MGGICKRIRHFFSVDFVEKGMRKLKGTNPVGFQGVELKYRANSGSLCLHERHKHLMHLIPLSNKETW
jgi:hypothetical protein